VDFSAELQAATAELKAKFDAGKTNDADLQASLASINALIAKHFKDGNREQLARLYLLDAHIYADGLNKPGKAEAIWSQVLRDFPGTTAAQGAALLLTTSDAPEGLEIGQRFPNFSVEDYVGQPLSVRSYLGEVTLIDFWATWCVPCREELPSVRLTYAQFRRQGFDIIGVSLDDDRNLLVDFLQAAKMPWREYFDGQGWKNDLAVRYGIKAIPANYLLDRRGVIIGKDLRGAALFQAVAKAMTGNK
jgi:thiol-disulfide isomerase/thioredoxin